MSRIARLFTHLAVWSLLAAGRFAEANDKAALRSLVPWLRMLLESPDRLR